MKFRLLLVGKPRDRQAGQVHDDYARRIERLGVGYETDWIPEVAPGGRFSEEHALEREAGRLVDRLGSAGGGSCIALDRRGQLWDSRELARRIERWAVSRATFVIGGPLGLHDSLLERADSLWSLSPLTLPHELARVVVAEQLYRALTILRGLPYHK
jgi:23S rRNA (pseudouridine1915-N3)-methyltransferase